MMLYISNTSYNFPEIRFIRIRGNDISLDFVKTLFHSLQHFSKLIFTNRNSRQYYYWSLVIGQQDEDDIEGGVTTFKKCAFFIISRMINWSSSSP